jgi:flagella basal body P-ring formation protein FlgA
MMLSLLILLLQTVSIEEHLRTELSRRVNAYYDGDRFQTSVSIKWMPSVLSRVRPEEITEINYLGNGSPVGTAVFGVRFSSGGRTMGQTVQASVTVKQLLPVYNRRATAGERLSASEVNMVWVELSPTTGAVVTEPAQLDSMFVLGLIQPGEPIKKSEVKVIPAVLPGQSVEMTMNAGGLAVVLVCKVREPASIGDRIKVWSESTRKHYYATITSREKAVWISTL